MFEPLLIAFAWSSPTAWLHAVVPWLEVALGIGLVIFFHELGHFAVAKACGVKCEKFYIGFDIGGRKLWKKQWGETEYGIGILPLGGYVKMLGQDDNPARQAEEAERAKAKPEAGERTATDGDAPVGDVAAPGAEPVAETVFDPRSYLAKSVPQRMAIISAGVIMNLVFAVVAATWAYQAGVPYIPCVIGDVLAGGAAFDGDVRSGDEITSFDEITKPRFTEDLMIRTALADPERGIPVDLVRPGESQPLHFLLQPRKLEGEERPMIGITSYHSLRLNKAMPAAPGTPAAEASPKFEGSDRIIAIDGQPIDDAVALEAYQVRHAGRPLVYTVVRGEAVSRLGEIDLKAESHETPKEVQITVKPRPLPELGLVMEMGPIGALRANSPAAEAGVKLGDRLLSIDGEPVGDPMTLPERLRRRAGESIRLALARAGEKEPVVVEIELIDPGWSPTSIRSRMVSVPALGIGYPILKQVAAVEPGSPADKAGVKPGMQFTKAIFQAKDEPSANEEQKKRELDTKLDLTDHEIEWLMFSYRLENSLPDTKVVLETKDGQSFRITPVISHEWFDPDRGLFFWTLLRIRKAESFGEAVQLALRETKENMLQVYWFIQRLSTRKLSTKNVGGPGTIAAMAAERASAGLPQFLIFLTMLNANLAVINFLPIPLLDGGHMVFLAIEGIRGKPVSERVLTPLLYIGLAIILSLMVLGITNDLRLFLHSLGFIGK